MNKKLLSLVFVIGLALAFYGCIQQPPARPSAEPTIPPLPSEAPSASPSAQPSVSCVANFLDGSCCRGKSCSIINADCIDMKTPVFKGCDATCAPIIECVAATPAPSLIGGDRDAHGCLIAAGYSWCESKQKCLRVWEENCSDECSSDADCVIGGCSHELCAAKSAGTPVSSCIWKPEYACYKLSRCRCISGGCGWDLNDAFEKCVLNASGATGLNWTKIEDGRWRAEDLACLNKQPIAYLCSSQCYEKSNARVWQLCRAQGEVKTNSEGSEVLCFSQGCFPDSQSLSQGSCQLVCPL